MKDKFINDLQELLRHYKLHRANSDRFYSEEVEPILKGKPLTDQHGHLFRAMAKLADVEHAATIEIITRIDEYFTQIQPK